MHRDVAICCAREDEPDAGSGFVGMALRRDDDSQTVVIGMVLKDSPAQKAGLQKDDALVTIAGTSVGDLRSAVDLVRQAKPRTGLPIVVRRDGVERTISVKVGVLPLTVLAGLD